MLRYIDADTLIKKIFPYDVVDKSSYAINAKAVYEAIQKSPTADVVEVRHGEWQQNPYCKRIYFCSECGRHIEDGNCNPYEHFPYCHCGAKMDKRSDT